MLSGGVKPTSEAGSVDELALGARELAASVLTLGQGVVDAMATNPGSVSTAEIHSLITHVEAATSGLAPFAQTVVPLGQSVTELSDALMALLGRLNDFLA